MTLVDQTHLCHCGKYGVFGHGVSLRDDMPGTWYCREHNPMTTPKLDINTPRGQRTLKDEEKAVALFENWRKTHKFVHTDKRTMAKADGLLMCNDKLSGVVLTSCRYNCSLATFQHNWNWEWLITWRKLAIGAQLAKHLQTPLYGFLYIVGDDTLLVKGLFDPRSKQWAPMRSALTETQATVNGGSIVRRNAFIKMDAAQKVTR